jgi:putative protease
VIESCKLTSRSPIMKRKIELLAPGGDIDSIKTAILAGADAVYCGLNKFNARNRAANISFEDLQGILRLAHKYNCEVFLTLNIIIVDSEIPALIKLLNKLVNTSIDGVIVQDIGLFYLLSNFFKGIKIHASTQLTTHNAGQIQFLEKLDAKRVNLSRELNIHEIKALTAVAHKNNVLSEVFVHGSYCISFSGICYMSSVHGGNSGNRGRCSQPCREKYVNTPVGKDYPLNLKDNSAYFDLRELYDAGVYSLKIEGRIKEFEYVYTVLSSWKKQIRSFYDRNSLINDNSDLYKVFNRDFSNSFLKGDINKDMFIDNPMSHSSKHLSETTNYSSNDEMIEGQMKLYEEKEKLRIDIKNKIDQFSIAKIPLLISISGQCGTPLKVSVKTPDSSFEVLSETKLADKGTEALDQKMILSRLKAINDTEFFIENIEYNLDSNLYLPFKQLTSIKKRLLFILNGSRAPVPPVVLPVLGRHNKQEKKPALSVLISSEKDIDICNDTSATIYFQLPNSFNHKNVGIIDLFKKNKKLIPWFPSVLIGDDYLAAVEFLEQLQPKRIVTNNTGIAFEAYKKGISWIAGPFLNITNSYSLVCLKEKFNCYGSFLSNEISKQQMKAIKKPENFQLYYSIYHPIVLMTSRQCLFHQVSGCEKNKIDDSCIKQCEKHSSITNLKKDSFIVEKTKGNYHTLYNAANILNTDIVKDMPNLYSGFMIDLRDIKTETKIALDKASLTKLFKNYLNEDTESEQQLKQSIYPSINTQYKQGI